MTLRFAVVHEARADFQTATELADRVLCQVIDWLDDDLLVHQREWAEFTQAGIRLAWTRISALALEAGILPMGHFGGEPGFPDAAIARRAIQVLRNEFPDLAAILLIRDQDDEPDRRKGLEQARTHYHNGLVIVIGLANVERECWVLCGFDPQDEAETACLESERRNLGFDLRMRSHELTACKYDNATRSPKRVLRMLSGDDRERERLCWRNCELASLRERGSENGLADFLGEVRYRLAPLIGHVPTE